MIQNYRLCYFVSCTMV